MITTNEYQGSALGEVLQNHILQPMRDPVGAEVTIPSVVTSQGNFYSVVVTKVLSFTKQNDKLVSILFEVQPLLRRPQIFSWGIEVDSNALTILRIEVVETTAEAVCA